jgi:hypothetical protein
MKKKALYVLSGLVVIVLGGVFGGQAWLKGRLQKDSLVEQMEAAWNCRAHVDETSVSFFSRPATVKITGLKLAPRDAEVDKLLAERAPLAPGTALVSANEVILSVQLTDLMSGTLNVEKLHVDGLDVRNTVDAQGVNSLWDGIFKSSDAIEATTKEPVAVAGAGGGAVPGEVKDAPGDPATGKPKKQPKPPKKAKLASEMLAVNLAVKSAAILNCNFEHIDLQAGSRSAAQNLKFEVSDIDVAPGDLANHNHAQFSFSAIVRHEKTVEKVTIADFVIDATGSVEPFNPKTGELRPDTDMSILVRKGGLLGGIPFEKQLDKKSLEQLKKKGINLGDIALGGVLAQDASAKVHTLPGGKMIFKQKTTLAFPQYEISMDEQSWLAVPQDLHNVKARLVVSPELSARIVDDRKKVLIEQNKKEQGLDALKSAAELYATDLLASGLMDEQKRLVFPYQSKGSISKPKVNIAAMAAEVSSGVINKVLNDFFPTEKKEEQKKDETKKEEGAKVDPAKEEGATAGPPL